MKSKTQVANAKSSRQQSVSALPSIMDHVEKNGLTAEEIRQRAYEIYIERGAADGCDVDDWLQAERERHANHGDGETPPTNK